MNGAKDSRLGWPLNTRNRLLVCTALACSIYGPQMAAAQQNDLIISEIIVTAQKREQSLQDVPISITAFDAESIQNYGFQTLEDIDFLVPNFKLDQGQGYTTDTSISIRGVTARDAALGFEPTVAVILDDVYIGRSQGFNTTLLDLERIEVLRGPQGTLQGRNVVGGAINLVTAKPSNDFYGRARASYGSYDSYDISGVISGPLVEDVLAAKISAVYRNEGGYGRQVDLDKRIGGVESAAVRGQLRFTPSEDLEIMLTGDYTNDDINDQGLDTDPNPALTSPTPALLDRRFGGDFLNTTERDIFGLALNVNYDINDSLRLVSVSSYRGFDLESDLDQDNSKSIGTPGAIVVHSYAEREQVQFSQEFRLQSMGNETFQWLVGLYYFYEDLDSVSRGSFGPFIPGLGVLGGFNQSESSVTTDNYAAFGSVTVNLTDMVSLTGGLRYNDTSRKADIIETTFYDVLAPAGMFGPAPMPFANVTPTNPVPDSFAMSIVQGVNASSVSDSVLTGDLSLNVQWTDDVSTYVKYARGHKSSGFNTSYSLGQAGGTVKPEFVDSFELGLRSYAFDRRLRFNATGFYLEYKDQQVSNFVIGPGGIVFVTSNVGRTESYGLEVEAQAILAEGLDLSMGLGWLDAKVKDGPNDGKVPFNSPEFTFSSVLKYVRPVTSSLDLFLQGEASWSDSYYTDSNNAPIARQDAYWLINLRVGIQDHDGAWALRAYAKNILNEKIQTTALGVGVFTLYGLTAPDTYGVEFSVNF